MRASQIPEKRRVRVCVIHTGGTIGMVAGPRGFQPVQGELEGRIAAQPQLRDAALSELGMPVSSAGTRVMYDVIEYAPLLDSSNMDMRDWVRIADDIGARYDRYDAFVVLHGTDTMAYTASALSFLLENLGKPVVLTGSQLPLASMRNDAVDNLLGAMFIAGHFAIPEVTLYFRNRLFRGNRAQKQDAASYEAFSSPKFPTILHLGIEADVRWDRIRPKSDSALRVHRKMDEHVAALRLFPGITPDILRNFVRAPLRGLVLETYGSGNAPDKHAELLAVLREAADRGVVLVNVTQCLKGAVTPSYATGRALVDAGVISGHDMTPEAALTKLSFLLGTGASHAEICAEIERDLRGELSLQN